MSEPAAETINEQPPVDGGAQTPTEESESAKIRAELKAAIDAGNDLTDKDVKVRVCHEVESKLQVPYGNVTKQVAKVLKDVAKGAGQPPQDYSKNVGGAKVTVKIPKSSVPDDAPPAPTDQQQQAAAQMQPAKKNLSDVYAEAENEEALRKTLEYKWMHKQMEVGVGFIENIYKRIGFVDEKDGLMPVTEKDMMLDMSVQMAMKYDWAVPEKIEKLVFFGAWASVLVLPVLGKFGVIDGLKDGTLFDKNKKKPNDKQSENPLTETKTRV